MKKKNFALTLLSLLACLSLLVSCAVQPAGSGAVSDVTSAVSDGQEAPAPQVAEETPGYDYTAGRKSRAQETPMGEPDTWTILLYVCGSNLESEDSSASVNLAQIQQAFPEEHVNVIVQTGGAEVWGLPQEAELMEYFGVEDGFPTAVVDPTVLQRYQLAGDDFILLDEQPLASMANPDTLYEFLSWGVENYPAEKMGAILWDHGGAAVTGACKDELFGDIMPMFKIAHAFDKVYDEMTNRFEFIGFDACLMATVEVANALVPHARYLYAAEETEPGFGWDYGPFIEELNRRPQVSGAELGTVLCDGFFDFYREIGIEDTVTLSVTDLEKIDPLLLAMDELAVELNGGFTDPAYYAQVARAAAHSESYYYEFQLDIGDFADNLKEIAPQQAAKVSEALQNAVVHAVSGSAHAYSNGLTAYYPIEIGHVDQILNYGTCYSSPDYYAYINEIHLRMLMHASIGEPLVAITEEPYLDEAGQYVMEIDPASLDYVREMGFMLFLAPEGNDTCYYLGYDNDVLIDYATGLVSDHFTSGWAHLDGEPLLLNLIDFNEQYNIYHSPIMLNGQRTNLVLKWTMEGGTPAGGTYEILGTFDGIDPYTGLSSRITRPLQAGDSVVPLYGVMPTEAVTKEELAEDEEYLDENGKLILVPGSTLLIHEDSAVQRSPLEAQRYLYQFAVTDVYGQVQTFVPIVFDVDEDGAISHPQ